MLHWCGKKYLKLAVAICCRVNSRKY